MTKMSIEKYTTHYFEVISRYKKYSSIDFIKHI